MTIINLEQRLSHNLFSQLQGWEGDGFSKALPWVGLSVLLLHCSSTLWKDYNIIAVWPGSNHQPVLHLSGLLLLIMKTRECFRDCPSQWTSNGQLKDRRPTHTGLAGIKFKAVMTWSSPRASRKRTLRDQIIEAWGQVSPKPGVRVLISIRQMSKFFKAKTMLHPSEAPKAKPSESRLSTFCTYFILFYFWVFFFGTRNWIIFYYFIIEKYMKARRYC